MNLFFNNSFIISLIVFVIILLFKYINAANYWSRLGVKGPWPVPLFGTLIYFLFEKRAAVDIKWYNKYGKVFGTFLGRVPVLQIGDPKLIKDMFVKDFHIFSRRVPNVPGHKIGNNNVGILNDEDWKRVRAIFSSAFTVVRVKKMFSIYKQCSNNLLNALEPKGKDGQEVDMKVMYGKYCIDVSVKNFPLNIDVYNKSSDIFTQQLDRVMNEKLRDFVMNLNLHNSILQYFKVPHIGNLGNSDTQDYFYGLIKNVLDERRKSNQISDDFISFLLKAEKNDNYIEKMDSKMTDHMTEEKSYPGSQRYLKRNEIIANSFIYIWTAYENISNTLSFCTHELALNLEVQEKLYSETMSSVDSNGEIDYDLVIKLPYLDAVISETLRMYPTSFHLKRVAGANYKLGETGITLAKGQMVEFPVYAMHYCEEYFENAKQFNPDRFLPENRHKIIPYSYLPFGEGPRQCFAIKLSLVEMKIVLVHLLKQYQFIRSTNTNVPVQLGSGLNVPKPKRVIIKFVKRL